ncbi:uncharacterized protein LOC127801658 [Diospyros lotus]|uniref:uncharacterized protein LOC127801658 n=1 Tax=Diospyros lotus TaxID=55363 RepID=UPI00224F4568|nr:uncharacterized protein LOC127801658 [Diospyros lotus]
MDLTATSARWASSSPMPSIASPITTTFAPRPTGGSFRPLLVSGKFRHTAPTLKARDPDRNTDDPDQEVRGSGRPARIALKLKSNPHSKPINAKQKQQEQERELSASDVLLALQRATAHKIKKKRRRERENRGRSQSEPRNEEEEEESCDYYSSVRAISIKSDWASRLDELEKRLQQLQVEIQQ